MQSYVLDSNILIYHLERDPSITASFEQWMLHGERLFISAITRIEVLAAPAMKPEEEVRIHRLLGQFLLVPVDAQIGDVVARIRRIHRLQLGDSIIAATALLTSSTLVTRNIRDFKKISELPVLAL